MRNLNQIQLYLFLVVAILLVVHTAANVFSNRRWTSWLVFIGVTLCASDYFLQFVYPIGTTVVQESRHGGPEIIRYDAGHLAAVQVASVIGALLVIAGLGTEVGQRLIRLARKSPASGK